MTRRSTPRLLPVLEVGARALRAVGLASVVERIGPALGGAAARSEVAIGGFRLSGNHAAHLFYLRELAEGRERFFAELVERVTPEGGLAVDAGAHIGFVTLHFARSVGRGGSVFAFEPNPEVLDVLRANLWRNGFADRVTVVPKAVGGERGSRRLFVSGGGETSSLADPGTARGSVEVEVVRLDDVLPEPPDVVKLDVEGGEPAALAGMPRLLASPRLSAVFAECNPTLLHAAGQSPEALVGALEGAGFAVWQIDERERRLVPFRGVSGSDYVNLLAARGDGAGRVADLAR